MNNFRFACLCVLCFAIILGIIDYNSPPSGVFSCSERISNPTEIQKQCERLTRGQWWNK